MTGFSNRQKYRPLVLQTGWKHYVSGLFANPVTGQLSHTKVWANVAGATFTYKFAMVSDAPEWMWFAYGSMVGGYALIKRGIAAIPQLAEIKQGKKDHVADFE